jgi:ubiquitin-conjugating enzyme E2 O
MLPDSTATNLPLERLTRLYDGLEQLEDMWDDDISDAQSSYATDGDHEEVWTMNDSGEWEEGDDDNGDGWSTDEEVMDTEVDGWSSSDPTTLQPADDSPASEMKVDLQTIEPSESQPMAQDVQTDQGGANGTQTSDTTNREDKETHWKRFEVLPSTPVDHAFYTSTPAQPSRNFLARLSKEYRVLSSSLPGIFYTFQLKGI